MLKPACNIELSYRSEFMGGFRSDMWKNRALFGASLAIFLAGTYLFYPVTLEDAFITFRYARHLADGYGYGIWNIGEPPVEGITTVLWPLILGLAQYAGLSLFHTAKIISILAGIGTISLFFATDRALQRSGENAAYRRAFPDGAFPLMGFATALYFPMSWYATTGMESSLFVCLITAALLLPIIARNGFGLLIPIAIALTLIRPEGVLFAVIIFGGHTLYLWKSGEKSGLCLITAISAVLTFTLLTAIRYFYFGDMLPNTYYAKASGGLHHMLSGLQYTAKFLVASAPILSLIHI